jgi:hypothetical protein
MRRLSVLLMAIAIFATGALAPAIANDDNGKKFAQGAFQSVGTGGAVLDFGAASPATPTAEDHWSSVRIFGYEDGPSQGQVFCGDVWNVIVMVDQSPFFLDIDRATMDTHVATQALDNVPVGPTDETAVKWSSTLGIITQAHGTFLPPGTLIDGWHKVKQTLGAPGFVFWDPPPLEFLVDSSAC